MKTRFLLTPAESKEWQSAARWCAVRGLKGEHGDPLPPMLSVHVKLEIDEYPESFQNEIRGVQYAIAMEQRTSGL